MNVKSFGVVLVLLMGTTLYGQNRTIVVSPEFRVASFTGNANGDCWAVGRGVAYHSLRIEVPSTVTAGNVKLQGSFSSTCASPADIIADQDVTMVTAVNGTAGVYPYVQVVASGYMGSGTLRVTYLGDTSSSAVGSAVTVTSGTVTADTELPAAAALADNTANPTVPGVGAFLMCFDGSTWDRCPVASGGVGESDANTNRVVGAQQLPFRSLDLDETEEEVKATAGELCMLIITNTATATRWVKVYNATAANVTVGTTTPIYTFGIPGNSSDDVIGGFAGGNGCVKFDTAITLAATTGVADADTGAPGANDVVVNAGYR